MAGEGELGFAKLLLSADSTELKKGIEEAKAHARSMGKTMAEVANEVGGKGRRILMVQHEIDRALINLTGTTTERQLAAVDDRYRRLLDKAKKSGNDTTALERAIQQEKDAILRKADASYQTHAEQIAGSNVHIGESLKGTTVEFKRTGAEVERTGGKFGQSVRSVTQLSGALGNSAGAAGKAAGALSNLLSTGLNPVAIATAALAVTIGLVIKKHQEQAEATKKATEAYREQRKEIFDIQAKVEAAAAGTNDDQERSLSKQIEEKERLLALSEKELTSLLASGKLSTSIGDLVAAGGRQERIDKQNAIAALKEEIDGLYTKRGWLVVTKDKTDGVAEANAEAAAQQDFWNEQIRIGTENQRKFLEAEDARIEKAEALAKKETELWKKANEERLRDFETLTKALDRLELERIREDVRLGGGAPEDVAALREAEQAEELRQLADHYSELMIMAKENGFDTTKLEEEAHARREQILEKYAQVAEETTADAAASAVRYAEVAAPAFERIARSVGRTNTSLLDLNAAQLGLLAAFRSTDMKMTVNGGRSSLLGNDPIEMMKRGMLPVASGIVTPGPLMFGPAFGASSGVKINVTNNVPGVGVQSGTVRMTPSGPEIDLIIAELIRKSGSQTDDALQDVFNLPRSTR